jgi:hypothetical protein
MRVLYGFLTFGLLLPAPAADAARVLSTEEFMNALGTCAVSMNLKLSGDLVGSIRSFYEGSKTQGTMSLQNAPEFLKLFPESDRSAAYKIYVDCVLKITQ